MEFEIQTLAQVGELLILILIHPVTKMYFLSPPPNSFARSIEAKISDCVLPWILLGEWHTVKSVGFLSTIGLKKMPF